MQKPPAIPPVVTSQQREWLRGIRNRAHAKGLAFDLTLEDLTVPACCPVLGIPLSVRPGRGRRQDDSPSVDRIDNSKGYTRNNIVIVSLRANRLKADASVTELSKIARFYRARQKERT
jgi:hypothetical protein